MATYNLLDLAGLDTFLQQNVSAETEMSILNALTASGKLPAAGSTIAVVADGVAGPATVPAGTGLFVYTGPENTTATVSTSGGAVLSTAYDNANIVDTGFGNDTLVGGLGRTILTVQNGNNELVAGPGHDTLYGGAGSDTMYGGGRSSLVAGTGNDSMRGGLYATSTDTLVGGSGSTLTASEASIYGLYQATLDREPDGAGLNSWEAALNGGETLAQITTGFINSPEFQTKYGSLNNTQFATLLYNNVLHRAPDQAGLNSWVNDLNSGGSRESVVDGFIESAEYKIDTATLLGGSGNSTIAVNHGQNLLIGGTGFDTLFGGDGADTMQGGGHTVMDARTGSGNESMLGGIGAGAADTLYGGAGMDTLAVNQGNNLLFAGSGSNSLYAGSGNDTIWGGSGHSSIVSGSGNASIRAGLYSNSSDTLLGGAGSDQLTVTLGNNVLIAGSGFTTMTAGAGNDQIYGQAGQDTINLYAGGNTSITGGSGSDLVNAGLTGNDTIFGGAATTVNTSQLQSDIKAQTTIAGGATQITFANGQVLEVKNATINFNGGGHSTF